MFIINDATIYYKLNCDFSIDGKNVFYMSEEPVESFLLFDLADCELS